MNFIKSDWDFWIQRHVSAPLLSNFVFEDLNPVNRSQVNFVFLLDIYTKQTFIL